MSEAVEEAIIANTDQIRKREEWAFVWVCLLLALLFAAGCIWTGK